MTRREGGRMCLLLLALAGMLPPARAGAQAADRGAKLDTAGFSVRREVPDASGGLVTLQLDASVLANSRGPDARFADVRLVDREGYQLPYLLEEGPEPLAIPLPIRPAESHIAGIPRTGRTVSVHELNLPYPDLPAPRLILETSARVFRRPVRLGAARPADRSHRETWFEQLGAALWQHADQDRPAPPLEMSFAPRGADRLLVILDEGDNRPLPLTRARLLLPSWRLRFFKPAAPVTLVYGKPDALPPQYDLALLSTAVMGAPAREVSATPELPAGPPGPALSPLLFWVALGLAAAVLLGLIVRLLSSSAS